MLRPVRSYSGIGGGQFRYNPIDMQSVKNLFRRFGEISLPAWAALAFIFAVCVYSFGILLARLGFFQDDWHHIFQAYWYGADGLRRFLLTDRGPFAYLVYIPFFKILGF